MSLTSIINIATSGVLAQQTAIAATAENIANVTTPDFARRTVNFSADPVTGRFSGVTAEIVREATNRFLQASALSSSSEASAAVTTADALQRIVDALGTLGDNFSFSNQASEATAALARLGANPSSLAAQREAVDAINSALTSFNRTAATINDERTRALGGLSSDIDQVNEIVGRIGQLNAQIASSGGAGSAADALAGQLTALSGLLTISVSRDEIGRATVTTGNGRQLADPSGIATLALSGGNNPQITISGLGPANVQRDPGTDDISNELTGGTIGGALSLVANDLDALTNIVNTARDQFVGALNAAAAGNTRFPPVQSLTGSLNIDDTDIAQLSGTTSLALLDGNGVLQSRIDIDFANRTFSVDGGAVVAFEPTAEGLRGAIASALGPNGGASVIGGVLNIDAGAGFGVALANDNAGLGALLGFNPLIVQSPNGATVRADILADPSRLAAGRLDLSSASIGSIVTGGNDGRGANALFEAGRGQSANIANALGEIGARANAASGAAAIAQSFADTISARAIAEGGVNLEEELSNLILFQRSFNANARVIAAADELYQSVLALI